MYKEATVQKLPNVRQLSTFAFPQIVRYTSINDAFVVFVSKLAQFALVPRAMPWSFTTFAGLTGRRRASAIIGTLGMWINLSNDVNSTLFMRFFHGLTTI